MEKGLPVGALGEEIALRQPIGWDLKNVSFTYPESDTTVIKLLSLTVAPGSTLVILGPSGTGKSTLLSMLVGDLSPTEGTVSVMLDGEPKSLTEAQSRLSKNIGYVGPESFIFDGTVYENLVYGLFRPVTDTEVREALEITECQFVWSLPHQLSHHLSDQGHGLSAGQKQRLSLARAFLRQPKALILDEATSNLDTETEARLIQTFLRIKGRMTVVCVTHRDSLLTIADRKIVLA
jgi:ATP-binding cassette subfamily B protein